MSGGVLSLMSPLQLMRCVGVGLMAIGCASARHPVMDANDKVTRAIAGRDMNTLEGVLSEDFRFEDAGGQSGDRDAWLAGVRALPYQILSVETNELRLEAAGDHAELCGVQRATVLVEGKPVVDEAPFCDRWEKRSNRWWLTFAGVPRPR